MTVLGLKLTQLAALPGPMGATDLMYLVRGGTQFKATVSQLRINSTQITNSTALGRSILNAANPSDVIDVLGLGDLAFLDTVGTSKIDNQAVDLDKLANITENALLIGDATNRPVEFPTTEFGRSILQSNAIDISFIDALSRPLQISEAGGMQFPDIGYMDENGDVKLARWDGTPREARAVVMCLSPTLIPFGENTLFAGPGCFIDGVSFEGSNDMDGEMLIYLDVNGQMTLTPHPYGPGGFSKIVGRLITPTLMHFFPDYNTTPLG